MEDESEVLALDDLGDVTIETKQCSPLGPFVDSVYGFGRCMG